MAITGTPAAIRHTHRRRSASRLDSPTDAMHPYSKKCAIFLPATSV